MRKKETREVPARTEQGVFSVTCDLCGKVGKTTNYGCTNTEVEWGDDHASRRTVIAAAEVDYGYGPDPAGDATHMAFDCCYDCFREKVVPALVALGLDPFKEQYYF